MIGNKIKRAVASMMIQDLKEKVTKDELIDWFILKTERGKEESISPSEMSVRELITLATNIGIEVRI